MLKSCCHLLRVLTPSATKINLTGGVGTFRHFSATANLANKKPKADVVLVSAKSIASDHEISVRKGRLAGDKVEFVAFDPELQREVIYKEHHKIKSIREDFEHWYTKTSELKLPDKFKQ